MTKFQEEDILSCPMHEGFATVSRNMAKAISEGFLSSVKVDLLISYDEEIQGAGRG